MRAFKSLAAIAIVLAAPASAGEITHFNRAAFQELQARNAPPSAPMRPIAWRREIFTGFVGRTACVD